MIGLHQRNNLSRMRAEFDRRMMEWDAEATKMRQSSTTEPDEAEEDKVSVRSSALRRSRSSIKAQQQELIILCKTEGHQGQS